MTATMTALTMRDTMKGFLTAAEVAKRFNVTSRTVVRWIEDGSLPGATKINPSVPNSPFLIPVDSVAALTKSLKGSTVSTTDNGKRVD